MATAITAYLLQQPTPDQERLLKAVAEPFGFHGRWPTWQYVDHMMARSEPSLDARQVLASFPAIGDENGGGMYRAVVVERAGSAISRESRVSLSILGLHLVDNPLAINYVVLIHQLAKRHMDWVPNEFEATDDAVSVNEVLGLPGVPHWMAQDANLEMVAQLISREPPTIGVSANGATVFYLRDGLRGFVGALTIESYVDAVSELLSVPDVGATIGDSPFAVTATLDYLDVTWRLHTGAPLVVLPGANRTARLESDVHTPAELDGALNAIYEVLTRLNVPKGNGEGHGLTRLRSWCSTNVDANDADRVEHAIDLLAAVIDLRNARQHNDTKPSRASERDACATLSIAWPIYDAPTTWRLVQSRCAYALDVIREAVRSLIPEQ